MVQWSSTYMTVTTSDVVLTAVPRRPVIVAHFVTKRRADGAAVRVHRQWLRPAGDRQRQDQRMRQQAAGRLHGQGIAPSWYTQTAAEVNVESES
jgi:hypothetical protein